MALSVSHPVSTRDTNIILRALARGMILLLIKIYILFLFNYVNTHNHFFSHLMIIIHFNVYFSSSVSIQSKSGKLCVNQWRERNKRIIWVSHHSCIICPHASLYSSYCENAINSCSISLLNNALWCWPANLYFCSTQKKRKDYKEASSTRGSNFNIYYMLCWCERYRFIWGLR
jgi:hypothetical protein